MNEQNLIPNSQRSRKELQEMGRKGGIASGQTRRRKKEMQKMAGWLFQDALNDVFKDWLALGKVDHEEKC